MLTLNVVKIFFDFQKSNQRTVSESISYIIIELVPWLISDVCKDRLHISVVSCLYKIDLSAGNAYIDKIVPI